VAREVRLRLSRALTSMARAHPSDRRWKKEAKVLHLLDTLRSYTDILRDIAAAAMAAEGGRADLRQVVAHGCNPIGIRVSASASLPDTFVVVCGKFFPASSTP